MGRDLTLIGCMCIFGASTAVSHGYSCIALYNIAIRRYRNRQRNGAICFHWACLCRWLKGNSCIGKVKIRGSCPVRCSMEVGCRLQTSDLQVLCCSVRAFSLSISLQLQTLKLCISTMPHACPLQSPGPEHGKQVASYWLALCRWYNLSKILIC